MNYKECCYIGDYDYASLLKNDANSGLDLMTKTSEYTYRKKGLSSKLSQDKINDLVKMYDRFIDPSFRPDWLPISQSILVSSVSDFLPSAGLARQHRATLRKEKKKKKDSKFGCT